MKKINKKEEELDKKENFLSQDVKKSIFSVALIVLALIFLLSLFGKAGVIGVYFNKFLSLSFGWGRYFLPILFLVVGIIYFKKMGRAQYYMTSVGAFILFLFWLTLVHSFFDISQMNEVAEKGSGGGYVGLAMAFVLVKYLGKLATIIVSVGFLAVGIILTFNFPLGNLFYGMKDFLTNLRNKISFKILSLKNNFKKRNKQNENENDFNGNENEVKIKSIEFIENPNEDFSSKELIEEETSEEDDLEKKSFLKNRKPKKIKNIFGGSSKWKLPSVNLLDKNDTRVKPKNLEKNAEVIKRTLQNFDIEVEVSGYNVGPTVVQYTFKPAVGVKLSKILALQSNLALALAAESIRIEAPIPGKSLIGIEIPLPEKQKTTVKMRSSLETEVFKKRESNLSVILGEDVNGDLIIEDIRKMPHLLVAGSTNTGKSVCVNAILTSLLYQNSPEELKLIMVDPKMVELSLYNGIPHLLAPVITDSSKVANALKWAINEMERRYKVLQEIGSKDMYSYNEKVSQGKKRQVVNKETGKYEYEELEKMPFIVIVVDELADLMSAHGKEVEGLIVRLAQKSRAVGIHLIVSTQRPEVRVITGLIKANITTRIALKVPTQVDSRTILDMSGAEKLLGRGDMLFVNNSFPKPRRLQGVFISENEIKRVVKFIKQQADSLDFSENDDLSESFEEQLKNSMGVFSGPDTSGEKDEELFEEAKNIILENNKASTCFLQRKLGIGYSRAARLVDMLEEAGVVGPADGSKPRQILISSGDAEYKDDLRDQEKREKWVK